MKTRKIRIAYNVLAIIILFITLSCNKESNDYRSKYYGDYRFTTIRECWTMGSPLEIDTIYYDGVVRKYKKSDGDDDKDRKEKITIEYQSDRILTSKINEDGFLEPEGNTPHYSQYGEFTHIDTIVFHIYNSGLGGGCSFDVQGVRK